MSTNRGEVQAICEYFRGADGVECQVESPPVTVTITEADIRQRKEIWK